MGVQPISLLRLRSAPAAYKSILQDALVELEALAELHEVPGLRNPNQELLEAVQASLDESHGGGAADIFRRITGIIGSE